MAFKLRGEKRVRGGVHRRRRHVRRRDSTRRSTRRRVHAAGRVQCIVNNKLGDLGAASKRRPARRRWRRRASPPALPGVQVDGNDIDRRARRRWTTRSQRARDGEGRQLHRSRDLSPAATTPPPTTRAAIAREQEVKAAWAREPLLRLRAYLTRRGAWDEEREEALKAECARRSRCRRGGIPAHAAEQSSRRDVRLSCTPTCRRTCCAAARARAALRQRQAATE